MICLDGSADSLGLWPSGMSGSEPPCMENAGAAAAVLQTTALPQHGAVNPTLTPPTPALR